jgi:membrane-bound ClpP family serine protease
METLLLAGVGLILFAFLLIVIEAFVPSGGVIGIAAGICAIAGVVLLFRYDTMWGVIGSLTVVVLGPVAFFSAVSMLPNTKLGRQMIGPSAEDLAYERSKQDAEYKEQRAALLDQEGTAMTALRPVGVVEVNGSRHNAVAVSGIIDEGTAIRVTSVDGLQITVRAVESNA